MKQEKHSNDQKFAKCITFTLAVIFTKTKQEKKWWPSSLDLQAYKTSETYIFRINKQIESQGIHHKKWHVFSFLYIFLLLEAQGSELIQEELQLNS